MGLGTCVFVVLLQLLALLPEALGRVEQSMIFCVCGVKEK